MHCMIVRGLPLISSSQFFNWAWTISSPNVLQYIGGWRVVSTGSNPKPEYSEDCLVWVDFPRYHHTAPHGQVRLHRYSHQFNVGLVSRLTRQGISLGVLLNSH